MKERTVRVNVRSYRQASWQPETVRVVNCKWTQWAEKEKIVKLLPLNDKDRNEAQLAGRHGVTAAAGATGGSSGEQGGGGCGWGGSGWYSLEYDISQMREKRMTEDDIWSRKKYWEGRCAMEISKLRKKRLEQNYWSNNEEVTCRWNRRRKAHTQSWENNRKQEDKWWTTKYNDLHKGVSYMGFKANNNTPRFFQIYLTNLFLWQPSSYQVYIRPDFHFRKHDLNEYSSCKSNTKLQEGDSVPEERVYKPSLGQTSWNLPGLWMSITKLQCPQEHKQDTIKIKKLI